MKEWGLLITVCIVGLLTNQAVYRVGRLIGKQLDELNEKVDALLEKTEESVE